MVFKQDVFLSKNRRKTPIFGSKTYFYHKKTIFMTTFINYDFTGGGDHFLHNNLSYDFNYLQP